MNKISMNVPSSDSSIIHSQSLYFPRNLMDNNIQSIDNQTLSLLSFDNRWIIPLCILSLLGILLTILILFLFVYISIRRSNNQLILTNLFICFGVCFIYIAVIFFLIHGNELFCGLREFLSQLAYALLYSALLCRYIMDWLAGRILSKRTKHLTSLLIYFLLICVQIPIGILWWYFTFPRYCHQRTIHEYPKLRFHFQKRISSTSSIKLCAYQCSVDYRFYATYTYTIVELFLCTIIAMYLFLYRHCHRSKIEKEQLLRINKNHTSLTLFNIFAFVLIDIAWLIWTFIYHFTHPSFVFSSLVIGMFTIGTICLLFILLPQIYFYSKINLNNINRPKTILFSNKLVSTGDPKEQASLLHENHKDRRHHNKQQSLSNESELSYELGTSGTFLPITRTPRGLFKVINTDKTTPIEAYEEHSNTPQISSHLNESIKNERTMNTSVNNVIHQQLQSPMVPLKRQSTTSSTTSNLGNPVLRNEHGHGYNSNIHPSLSPMYYSSYTRPRRDETIIPILCSPQSHQTTPVKMRILFKSPSLSVPITQRIYSGNDHRYIHHPYHNIISAPPRPSATPPFHSSPIQQQYLFVDPYRTKPLYTGDNIWRSNLSSSHRSPYSYHQFSTDNRLLSQRLWDIESGDEEDEVEANIPNTRSHLISTRKPYKDFHSNHTDNEDQIILHIDDEVEEEESYNENLYI